MPVSEDLINFDIIETHKENIQPLASGRSAKSLASTFAPASRSSAPTPGDTRDLNDAIREEYEIELRSIKDSDDPLDIYDRYVKWTLAAYPSAQATPGSQLRPLLEKATKAFQSVVHYKNDPRYLKLWLHYIRFFSDAPREAFAYLARHNIGEGLALFYEEFSAWLESHGRWRQADEVYRLGIEREARPVERLTRKFGEFQHRFEERVVNGEEPLSPALPTIRPALAAKIDPFAVSTPISADPQAPRPSSGIGGSSTCRAGRQKLTIFSDIEAPMASTGKDLSSGPKGWNTIGSIAERKKENVMGARPWAGETLNAGKRPNSAAKMAIYKDESRPQISPLNAIPSPRHAGQPQITYSRTGKIERVFVNLDAIYPNDNDPHEEISFEELRAKNRGWLSRIWAAESKEQRLQSPIPSLKSHEPLIASGDKADLNEIDTNSSQQDRRVSPAVQVETTIAINISREGKVGRPKKTKIKEVRAETQTIKANLESPTGPKLRRKNSAEPTMTLHTKAATDDILDIFNQPLRNIDPMAGTQESDVETDYDEDDYTSAGESTGTGRISGTSEFGETEPDLKTIATNAESASESTSPWSDFTASKHVPKLNGQNTEGGTTTCGLNDDKALSVYEDANPIATEKVHNAHTTTPVSPSQENEILHTRYIPIPPEDYGPPARCPRDPTWVAQNRLPFMTPIIEKTETSLGALSIQAEKEDYFNSRTPSRRDNDSRATPVMDGEPLSSPLQEVINESPPIRVPKMSVAKSKFSSSLLKSNAGPIIKDVQCNPVDDSVRQSVLDNLVAPLISYQGYHDHRPTDYGRAGEIRKFIRSLSKAKASEKTTTSLSLPPILRFDPASVTQYTIRRELGKGAFAPVYLAEEESTGDANNSNTLIAIKSEHPPTSWEFYIMAQLHIRLTSIHRASASLLRAHSLHLFRDEGYLLEQYMDQGTLLDLVNLAKSDPTSGQTTLDESVVMFFTIELIRTVEAMHSVGILHGDLKADNCLVRLHPLGSKDDEWNAQYQPDGSSGWSAKGLTLIDFGRSIDLTTFRSDVQFIADWKTSKQDCIEMRELRPWTYQIDYYGIAGVVHSLLYGKYIEDCAVEAREDGIQEGMLGKQKKYKIREGLRRYWQTELWGTLFDLLLNPLSHLDGEEGQRMPCRRGLRKVREGMEGWLMGEGGKRNGGLRGGLARLEGRMREKKGR